MKSIRYKNLPTEQNNPHSRHIDRASIKKALKIINQQDSQVPKAVGAQISSIEKGVKTIVRSLSKGGKLLFIGAGTSGRLGILEAAECPPTFNTPPSMVQALMAGGKQSVFRSKEGAEDRGSEAAKEIRKKIVRKDVVVGIAASGVTSYVKEGLRTARKKGAKTILVTCHPGVSKSLAHVVIAIKTGPEVIAGSTRLKAGTATKLALNSLTVASMIQLGKVYGNRMVDLQPRSKKLTARAIGLISKLGGVNEKKAEAYLKQSKGQVKVAIVMAKKKISASEAKKHLAKAKGYLYRV